MSAMTNLSAETQRLHPVAESITPDTVSMPVVKGYIEQLSQAIKDEGFAPSVLVAVARGGWVPVRLLSNVLGTKEIVSIGIFQNC